MKSFYEPNEGNCIPEKDGLLRDTEYSTRKENIRLRPFAEPKKKILNLEWLYPSRNKKEKKWKANRRPGKSYRKYKLNRKAYRITMATTQNT